MGDTGSLALGGVLAGLAVCTKTQLLLAILGGLFVVITLSVIIQVGSFKMTGKRVFRMAPLQHHFELRGLGGNHHRDPVLADLGHVRRARPRHLLRGMDAQVAPGTRGESVPHSGLRSWPTRRGPPRVTGGVARNWIMDQVAPGRRRARAPASWTGQARDRVAARFGFLDRPLTYFYLVLGITTLLLALGLVMVLSTSSAAGLMAGGSPWSGLQHQLLGVLIGLPCMWLAARSSPSRYRAAAYPLMFVSLLGLVAGAVRDPDAGQRRGGPLAADRRLPVPAVRAGQVRVPAVGRRPAGPQGEAGPAGRLAAAAHPAAARGRLPGHAGDARRRPGHHVRAADHLPGAAVDHRHAGPGVRRDPGC